METTNQSGSDSLNPELTQLRGANEAMIQRIEALTRIVENLVTLQAVDEDAANTPITNGNNYLNLFSAIL
jgi:hypothetical protein